MKITDDFNGDTPHLIECINALIEMNDAGALVPHGIGGHARSLLSAAAVRLAAPPPPSTQADARDAERLAFLANLYVVARKPARYGSFECFSHSPDPDECEEFDPEALNKLRAAIDRAQESGNAD